MVGGVLLGASALSAQPASAPWMTIDTPHFRVHYPAPFEKWAAHAASAIEGIHERVTDFVGYRPAKPIDVMIEDPAAVANGIAYPFLDRPVIILWTSPPEAESDIGEYGDWMELVVTHEMAHIAHLTRPRNRPGFLESSSRSRSARCSSTLRAGSRKVRDARRGRAHRLGAASLELPGDGAAPVRGRGEAPSYRSLFDVGGLGGSMAYLVGSACLEWLEAREGKGSLQKLWKRRRRAAAGASARPFAGLRTVAGGPVRPVPRGGHGEGERGGERLEGAGLPRETCGSASRGEPFRRRSTRTARGPSRAATPGAESSSRSGRGGDHEERGPVSSRAKREEVAARGRVPGPGQGRRSAPRRELRRLLPRRLRFFGALLALDRWTAKRVPLRAARSRRAGRALMGPLPGGAL